MSLVSCSTSLWRKIYHIHNSRKEGGIIIETLEDELTDMTSHCQQWCNWRWCCTVTNGEGKYRLYTKASSYLPVSGTQHNIGKNLIEGMMYDASFTNFASERIYIPSKLTQKLSFATSHFFLGRNLFLWSDCPH